VASIGHIAVGMAAGRDQRWTTMASWSALALLPDADVIGFSFGVRYADPWGHRGATHSIVFALLVATAIAAAGPKLRLPRLRTWLVASLVLVSHGLLDTLTDGGLGVALFWPFDLTRYFAPWRPIPVAPIGVYMLSPYGFFVVMIELVFFAPLIVFAIRRPRPRIAWVLTPIWLAGVWLIASGDPVRNAVMGVVLREQTEYAQGFSERGFQSIEVGQSDAEVRRLAGAPLGEWWDYFSGNDPAEAKAPPGCPYVYLESDRVTWEPRDTGPVIGVCARNGVHAGTTRTDVLQKLGTPMGVCWRYSRSPDHHFHRVRVVCFAGGKVVDVMRRWERG
jgi:inner membrane protein